MSVIENTKRDVMLNFRFSFPEVLKIEKFMRRHGYTSRSQLIRDAILKDWLTTYVYSEGTDIDSAIDLFDGLESVRKQINKVVSNTLQIVRRFDYYAYLDVMLYGIFEYDKQKDEIARQNLLAPGAELIGKLISLYEAAKPVFMDERIMKIETDMTETKDPATLRREYKAAGTTAERKLEIIRSLYDSGNRSYLPASDKDLYLELLEARKEHDERIRVNKDLYI